MKNNYIKGSEWIKCDLHIHTPYSIDQHYGDEGTDGVWEKFIKDLEQLPSEFKIIGINDYLFIDGYKKVQEFKKAGRLKNINLLLPVIELRIDKFGTVSKDNPLKRVNFHIIFSDELEPDFIKAQFLDSLNSEYQLLPDYTSNKSDWGGVITRENLIHLGQKLIDSSGGKLTGTPLRIGFSSLNISYVQLLEKLKNPRLDGKFLTAVGKTEWDQLRWESSPAEKKNVINKADFVFTASESPESFDRAKKKLQSENVNDLLLDCSDAHHFSNQKTLKDRIGNCFTWVKINPTFRGLEYLKYEPHDRIFVGELPDVEKRVNQNKTRYISKLSISQVAGYNESQGVWFKDQFVYPSKELTAIIGNKGKGKSAITDIIGLLGNSHNEPYFSFISKNKFRKSGLAKNFEAKLDWESGIDGPKNLNESIDEDFEEKVKYLPQRYFEDLCNEIDDNENFKKEINQVVFKHIDKTERLGKGSFDDFIEEKKKNAESTIDTLRDDLNQINLGIVNLQKKKTEENKKNLTSKIDNLETDLKSHLQNKPINPFPDSTEDSESEENGEETSDNYKKLKEVEKSLQSLQKQQEENSKDLETLNSQLLDLQQIRHRFESESERITVFKSSEQKLLDEYSINIEEVYPIQNINLVPVDKVITEKENSKTKKELHLGKVAYSEQEHASLIKSDTPLLFSQMNELQSQYDELAKSLDETQKMKEDYNSALIEWERKKNEIEGDKDNPAIDTLEFYKKELKYIEEVLSVEISTEKNKRKIITEKIYDEKKKIVDIYTQLKENIDKKLQENAEKIKDYRVTLDASFQIKNFTVNFLDFLDKNRIGSFQGSEEAFKKVKDLEDDVDSNNRESVLSFLEDLDHRLEYKEEEKQNPFNQIKSSKKLQDLYDFIFGLDFLDEKYELKFANKSIEQLSPGERGAALIVFYLLLDNDDKPLIIDQPEDNLDNQSVYEILVPFIKQAKKHRQLIIVTHNPNLAVVADAEQVVHVNIDKENKNTFSFNSGGIENPIINKGIVDILEGTMPAFDKRKLKYLKRDA